MTAIEKIVSLQDALSRHFFEREEAIEGAVVALGCRQHVLFLGPPGTAKSEMVMAIASAIDGARLFSWCLGKDSKTDELFGPVSIKALEEGRYARVITGKLPEADIAFVDEVFRANTTVLNNMLTIMHERIFRNDGKVVLCPLITLFGAANDLPQGEEELHLAAFADRFLLKYQVGYLAEDSSFASMLQRPVSLSLPSVTMADLKAYQAEVATVQVGKDVVEVLLTIRRALKAAGHVASDRRWRQSLDALKAKAALAGDGKVNVERDFDILTHILPATPLERRPVAKIIREIADPLGERVMEILDTAQEITAACLAEPENALKATEVNGKLFKMVQELQSLSAKVPAPSRARVKKTIEKVMDMRQRVVNLCLAGVPGKQETA